jgi:hypothetical protein
LSNKFFLSLVLETLPELMLVSSICQLCSDLNEGEIYLIPWPNFYNLLGRSLFEILWPTKGVVPISTVSPLGVTSISTV